MKERVLNDIIESFEKEHLTKENVCFFMQQVRILLEINNDKKKYAITEHYCNWLLHKSLNRSNSPIIIDEISKSFENFKSKNDLIIQINNALSLKKLVIELREILWKNVEDKKRIVLSDRDDYWVVFLQVILNQILQRPLLVKKEDITIEKFNFSIYGIQIVIINNTFSIELLSKELEAKNKRITTAMILTYENYKENPK